MRWLAAYVVERFPLGVFAPFILLLSISAWLSTDTATPTALAKSVALTTMFVVQFRLWDDLADRERDRLTHAHRAIVRAPRGVFLAALVAIAGVNLMAFASSRPISVELLAYDAAAMVMYGFGRSTISEHAWRYGVLPIKYAACVSLTVTAVDGAAFDRTVYASVGAYVAAIAYEWWHTRPDAVRSAS